jgi:tellurite resistance-related uncharacterized protein
VRKQPSLDGKDILSATTSDGSESPQSELPSGLEIYARTPDFTHLTVPAELTTDHALAEGVWGVLRVLEGTLLLRLADRLSSRTVGAGEAITIEPELSHCVQLSGPTRFFIEFHISSDRVRANIPTGSC